MSIIWSTLNMKFSNLEFSYGVTTAITKYDSAHIFFPDLPDQSSQFHQTPYLSIQKLFFLALPQSVYLDLLNYKW